MGIAAVFPATFDPVTNGHVDIFDRAASLFDRLVIGVYSHPYGRIKRKRTLFTVEERVQLVESVVTHLPNVTVQPFYGLAVELARAEGAQAVVRGLRVADDFEFERQMAMMNRHLAPDLETVLLVSQPDNAFVSSSLVREVALMGGDVSRLVPPIVTEALVAKAQANLAAAGHGRPTT